MTSLANRLSRHGRAYFVCALSVLVLFPSYFANGWGLYDESWFAGSIHRMEGHIVSRLVQSAHGGLFSYSGLTGTGSRLPAAEPAESFEEQVTAYLAGESFASFKPYRSQIGGQGMLFSILDRIIPGSPHIRLRFFHAMTAFMTAVALAAIVLWFHLEFGWIAAMAVLISTLFSQMLTIFAGNLWWSTWAFYVPVAGVMFLLRASGGLAELSHFKLGAAVFFLVAVKCTFNGYEFITSALVMMVVPFVYYAFRDRIGLRRFLTGSFAIAVGSALALLLTVAVLCLQLAVLHGEWSEGVKHIAHSLGKRTHGESQAFPSVYRASLEAPTGVVVRRYLDSPYFSRSGGVEGDRVIVRYGHLATLFAAMSALLALLARCFPSEERRKLTALNMAMWFSLCGPLSWFIIFKAHSYIHVSMNEIVWHMPFVLFGFAVCGLAVQILVFSPRPAPAPSRRSPAPGRPKRRKKR